MKKARPVLVWVNPKFKSQRPRMDRATRRLLRMHSQQLVSGKLAALRSGAGNHARPGVLRDALALFPLQDSANGFATVGRHVGRPLPDFKNFSKVTHCDYLSHDELSRQMMITRRVTECQAPRTISAMGRRVTPSKFKSEFCGRLKAARIVAGLTQAEMAQKLGELPNTYTTYEKRTLLPHDLIPLACEILGVDETYLFTGKSRRDRKAA